MATLMTTALVQVRSLLDEPTAQFWSTAELEGWINQGCRDIARKAENLYTEYVVTVTPAQQNYPVPANFLNAHYAEFTLGGGVITYPLRYMGYQQLTTITGVFQSLPSSHPTFFTCWGTSATGRYIRLFPVPAATGSLHVFYYRDATTATHTGALDIYPGWTDIVFAYAVFKAKQKDRDPTWQTYQAQYTAQLVEEINHSRRMTDQGDVITSGPPQSRFYQYGVGI